jgi:MOSC domain-containing protein YiiM
VIEQIIIRATAGGEPVLPGRAEAEAGLGLRGDRYHGDQGTYSHRGRGGRDLTLIEAEALERVGLSGAQSWRNLVTRGVDLDALIGKRFRIGTVQCYGARDCPPCALLERRTRPGVLRALARSGGLRADILAGGEIAIGDELVVEG